MALNASRSPAHPEPPRQRLTSPWTLLGVAAVVGVTLVLIFPGRGLLTQKTVERHADQVSTSYLNTLAKQEPQTPELRFTLAEKEAELGKIAEARAALEPLYNSPDPGIRQRARVTDFKLQMQQMYAFQPGSGDRQRANEKLRQELVAMSQYEWDEAGLLDLAKLAEQVGDRKLRAEIYLRIAKNDPRDARKWLDQSTAITLADGGYRAAAETYFSAMDSAPSREDKRYYFMEGVKAYQAGNMIREALAAADRHIDGLADEDEILRFMIRLARMANDMPRAQAYAKKLMRMSESGGSLRWLNALATLVIPSAVAADAEPRSPARIMAGMRPYNAQDYQLAYEVFLANRSLDDAYRVAAAAVLQNPGDMAWRERLAQIAEWSNRPSEALEQWLYIARRSGSGVAWQAVLRIAPGLFEDEALLEAMRYQATKGTLTDDQWRAVVDAYERVGRPREAVAMLQREYERKPRPVFLELQATLYDRMGDLDGAIAANRRVIETSGATTPRIANLVTLLLARGDNKEAYALLESHRSKVSAEDAEYWRLLADLALQLQEDVTAERALDVLVKSDKAQPDDFNRLIALLQPRQPEAAARLAELAYERFKTTDYLVAALGIYSERRDFIAMRRVFGKMTPEVEADLARSPDFLMLRAEYRNATGHPDLARADYREAYASTRNIGSRALASCGSSSTGVSSRSCAGSCRLP